MAILDPRRKGERIAALFRERRQTDILPAELMPADLDEAYAIRAVFEEIEVARGRGAVAGWASRPRSRCGSAKTCRREVAAIASSARSRAVWRRSNCWRICATTTSG